MSGETLFRIAGILGYITTLFILIVLAVKEIVGVLRVTGLLPKKLSGLFLRERKEMIRDILDELGVLPRRRYYRSITHYLDSPLEFDLTNDEIKERFLKIAKEYLESTPVTVGDVSHREVGYYVNIRNAFCTSDCSKELVLLMASFVRNTILQNHIECDGVVSRKGSLDLLGYHVAQILRMPFLLHQKVPTRWRRDKNGRNKGMHFEYSLPEVKHLIIVDDATMSANSIAGMIRDIRDNSMEVEDVFVFFIRGEGRSLRKIEAFNVRLHYLFEFTDQNLKLLQTTGSLFSKAETRSKNPMS